MEIKDALNILICVSIFFIGIFIGIKIQDDVLMKTAINKNVAHYIINEKTGESKFVFCTKVGTEHVHEEKED